MYSASSVCVCEQFLVSKRPQKLIYGSLDFLLTTLEMINVWCRSHSGSRRTNGTKFTISLGNFVSGVSGAVWRLALYSLLTITANKHLPECSVSWKYDQILVNTDKMCPTIAEMSLKALSTVPGVVARSL